MSEVAERIMGLRIALNTHRDSPTPANLLDCYRAAGALAVVAAQNEEHLDRILEKQRSEARKNAVIGEP